MINGSEKKKLLMRLLEDAKGIMDEFLKKDLKNKINYGNPDIQHLLYWLAILLRDIMAVAVELRVNYDETFQDGGIGLILHEYLREIEALWPEDSRTHK